VPAVEVNASWQANRLGSNAIFSSRLELHFAFKQQPHVAIAGTSRLKGALSYVFEKEPLFSAFRILPVPHQRQHIRTDR
jgi:hypothetical protein